MRSIFKKNLKSKKSLIKKSFGFVSLTQLNSISLINLII
jgi:hypothetical protein